MSEVEGGIEGFLRVFQVYGCTRFFRFRVQDRGRGCRDLRASSGWPSSLVFAFWASLSLSLLGHPVSAEERLSYVVVVYVERGIYLRRPRLLVGDERGD